MAQRPKYRTFDQNFNLRRDHQKNPYERHAYKGLREIWSIKG